MAQERKSDESIAQSHYVLRLRKRDLHGLAVVAVVWIVWSQGGEIFKLFSRLFSALAQ